MSGGKRKRCIEIVLRSATPPRMTFYSFAIRRLDISNNAKWSLPALLTAKFYYHGEITLKCIASIRAPKTCENTYNYIIDYKTIGSSLSRSLPNTNCFVFQKCQRRIKRGKLNQTKYDENENDYVTHLKNFYLRRLKSTRFQGNLVCPGETATFHQANTKKAKESLRLWAENAELHVWPPTSSIYVRIFLDSTLVLVNIIGKDSEKNGTGIVMRNRFHGELPPCDVII
ncbi:LOW QUALITY PROTEIN: hypothetical protein V1477_011700 [Vespula maculifrons]|uniref:Uncharacterized protein n=1 Tax=Vespula maculifrons TaxID=7453 RepID=A0ABD2BZY1_VESMC